MTDVNIRKTSEKDGTPAPESAHIRRAIELLFFAYRDFTGDPDAILSRSGYGRAHHRVLHFVGAYPGINVAQLLAILQITKQSLGRVLKQLVDEAFVEQRTAKRDRRQRLLFLTEKGKELENLLSTPQQERVRDAFAAAGPEAVAGYLAVLENLINAEDRRTILANIERQPGAHD